LRAQKIKEILPNMDFFQILNKCSTYSHLSNDEILQSFL
jgi:hypothetical protein